MVISRVCRGRPLIHGQRGSEYQRKSILHHHDGQMRVARVSWRPPSSPPLPTPTLTHGLLTLYHSGKHVVFGEVVNGMDVVKAIEKVGSRDKDGKVPSDKKVVIINCGTV